MTATTVHPLAGTDRTFRPLTVAAIEPAGEAAVRITLRTPEEAMSPFPGQPGQHVTIRIGDPAHGELRRSYSICASGPDHIQLGVRMLPGGRVSTILHDRLQVGDELDVMPPLGAFTLDRTAAGHHALVAAGSGITPVLAMVTAALADPAQPDVTLIDVNRTTASAMFVDDLHALKSSAPGRLQLLFVTTRERRAAPWCSRRPDGAALVRLLDDGVVAPADRWYLCGPDEFVADCRAALAAHGVADARIRSESFGARRPALPRTDDVGDGMAASVQFTFRGQTSTAVANPGEPLLDATTRARPDVPYSCRTGSCSTCRARLVAGVAGMVAAPGLTDDERAAGFVLTCRAFATSRQVVLDFDV